MRSIKQDGSAPLDKTDIQKILTQHIPYRMLLLNSGVRSPATPPTLLTSQAFEAGVLSGRILLSFMGLGCDSSTGLLRADQRRSERYSLTDDVKAPDVGGRFIEPLELAEDEKKILSKFIQGAHKACAHFTINSDHQLNSHLYAEAGAIIFRLMGNALPSYVENMPKWSN